MSEECSLVASFEVETLQLFPGASSGEMKMVALAFVLALVHLASGDLTCTTDEDCSLNGVCIRNGTMH